MNLRDLAPRLFDVVATWLIRRARRTPYTHLHHADRAGQPGAPYMLRYWLFRIGHSGEHGEYPWIGARVHVICSSDDDRAFHDHPWPFVSVILRGRYVELQPYDLFKHPRPRSEKIGQDWCLVNRSERAAGSIAYRRADTWHMVRLAPRERAITLFITFPKLQTWGFLVRRGRRRVKVPWREFEREHGGGIVVVNPL